MDDRSRGEGWLFFAGLVLMVAGVMRLFDAIWAWTYNGPVSGNLQSALLGHSLTTYGWVWLVVAIILFAAGLGVIVRSAVCPLVWYRRRCSLLLLVRFGGCPTTRSGRLLTSSSPCSLSTRWRLMVRGNPLAERTRL